MCDCQCVTEREAHEAGVEAHAKRQAAGALWILAFDDANRRAIAEARGIAPLVQLVGFLVVYADCQDRGQAAVCTSPDPPRAAVYVVVHVSHSLQRPQQQWEL